MEESDRDRNESRDDGGADNVLESLRRMATASNRSQERDTWIDLTVRLWDHEFHVLVEEGADWRSHVGGYLQTDLQLAAENLEVSDVLMAEVDGSPVRIESSEGRIHIMPE